MTKIALGKVAFTDAGEYSKSVSYKRLDFVTTEDSCYLSLVDGNLGNSVDDTTKWKPLALGTAATVAAARANAAVVTSEAATESAKAATTAATTAAATANASATNADKSATVAIEAAEGAVKAAADAQSVVDEAAKLEALNLVPTAMELEYPETISLDNKEELRIVVTLAPASVKRNVLFLGDGHAVDVDPDGRITVRAEGTSVIHVIPTCNTALYRTIRIRVSPPVLQLTEDGVMMLLEDGGGLLN